MANAVGAFTEDAVGTATAVKRVVAAETDTVDEIVKEGPKSHED